MKLHDLIHTLSRENSPLGELSRDMERDRHFDHKVNERHLKEYWNKKTLKSGRHGLFVDLLNIQELINNNSNWA
jgi:uncharacterized protein (DUF1919 family)